MKQCFFAVDLGATSGRTILGTFTSNGLEMEEVNRFPNHLIEAGRHFYWDIYELYRHIIEGLRIAARKGVEITSIGIDTWGVDFVCVGKDGVSWALSLVECVTVWALKLPVPHTDVLKPTSRKVFPESPW